MNEKKRQELEKQLAKIELCLANAESYVAKNVNVEGSGFLHFGDWQGKSGHPLWMKNCMIPRTLKERGRIEKLLDRIDYDAKGRKRRASRRKNRDCKSLFDEREI